MRPFLSVAALAGAANAYFLTGNGILTTQRLDPIVNPNTVSSHVHIAVGGSNFGPSVTTAKLRQSKCTSHGIAEDTSAYWWPDLYFQWANGSFSNVNAGSVIYYLFSDTPGVTTAFPDDFRMISGDPFLRTYNASSYAQQAVTFLCLNFQGTSTRYNMLPPVSCPSGVRAQINFPSCWDGVNVDSPDHKSHVDFLSGGPDSGTCSNPKFPKTLPRIFTELYFSTGDFESVRSQAMNPTQPFVFSTGDDTGYGHHADFFMGWKEGVLQKVVDGCHCNPFGDAQCCADQGLLTINKNNDCHITNTWDEQTTGTLPKLPGNNPVQHFGKRATAYPNNYVPPMLSPVYAYVGNTPPGQGSVVAPGSTVGAPAPTNSASPANPSISPNVNVVVPDSVSQSSTGSPVPTILSLPSSIPPMSMPSMSMPSMSAPPMSTPVPGADGGCGDSNGSPPSLSVYSAPPMRSASHHGVSRISTPDAYSILRHYTGLHGSPSSLSMPSMSGNPATQTADASSTTPTPPPVDAVVPSMASGSGATPSSLGPVPSPSIPQGVISAINQQPSSAVVSSVYSAIMPTTTPKAGDDVNGVVYHGCTCTCEDDNGSYSGSLAKPSHVYSSHYYKPAQSGSPAMSSGALPLPVNSSTIPSGSPILQARSGSTPLPDADGCDGSDGTPSSLSMPYMSGIPATQSADATSTTPTSPPVDAVLPSTGSSSGAVPSTSRVYDGPKLPLTVPPGNPQPSPAVVSGVIPGYSAMTPATTPTSGDGVVHHRCTCTCTDGSGSLPAMPSGYMNSGVPPMPVSSAMPSISPAVQGRSLLKRHKHRRMHNDEFY